MFRLRTAVFMVLLVLPTVLSTGCGDEDVPLAVQESSILDQVALFPYELLSIPDEELWDTGYGVLDTTSYDQDDEGVRLLDVDGRFYYQPVTVANWGLALHDNYKTTGNPAYLQLALKHADKLIAEAETFDGVYYYPYKFDFKLHKSEEPADFIPAPWYSGMAQGRVMALLVRLYKEVGDEKYLEAARKTLPSFLRPRGSYEPFTVEVDPAGFYWVEEYPRGVPTQVLNGFIYSLYGVYEYYTVTQDETALRVVQASLTTLRQYVADFRAPGEVSFYCLAHRKQITIYHWRHIRLVNDLYRMSGDTYFKSMVDLFKADISN